MNEKLKEIEGCLTTRVLDLNPEVHKFLYSYVEFVLASSRTNKTPALSENTIFEMDQLVYRAITLSVDPDFSFDDAEVIF